MLRQITWHLYLSVLDYRQFYHAFVGPIHQRCFSMVLADVGCGFEKEVCMHRKDITNVALACRRVGSKRVKV